MLYRVALGLCVSLLFVPGAARADDWLLLAPGCSHPPDARSLGTMALLYPRIGLPAVVHAGERMVTRVRVPSPLTPPPGIQQDRALVGWSAELVGDGRAPYGGPTQHRYPLRVVDVRPDGPATLVYRASVLVPRWAASGTYALRMSAPGGTASMASAVRVLAPGASPRFGRIGPLDHLDDAARVAPLADAAVDVWIAADDARLRTLLNAPVGGSHPVPVVLLLGDDGPAVVLRAGGAAHVLGRCSDRYVPFEEQVEQVLAREGLRRAPLTADVAAEHVVVGGGDPLPLPSEPVVAIDPSGERVRAGALDVEVTLLLPVDGRATTVGAAGKSFFPATPVDGVNAVPTVALRLSVAAGSTASVARRAAEPLQLAVGTAAERVETAVATTFTAEASQPLAMVGWQLTEDRTAVGDTASTAFGILGPHTVHALAISEQGLAARASARVEVVTREVRGCGSACSSAGGGPGGVLLWLIAVGLLIRGHTRRK